MRGAYGFMQCFDEKQNLYTAARFGSLYYQVAGERRIRAENNVALSFPDWTQEQIQSCTIQSFQYMAQLFLVDAVATPRLISPGSWVGHVQFRHVARVLDHLVRREPLILITGHCGNWELMGFVLAVFGFPMSAIARPLDNPLLNKWLLGIRESRGLSIITKWGAIPALQKLLRSGGRVGFIADQDAGEGHFVPFFGRLASAYKSIGLLAMRYNIPIVCGQARRLGPMMRYELSTNDLIMPHEWKDQPDPLYYITARYTRAIERMIRNAPEQYLWLHRRWKTRPRFERESRPMPKRMIRKLRELPWMTDDELGLIIERSEKYARAFAAGEKDPLIAP